LEPEGDETPAPEATPAVNVARIPADTSFAGAARGFLESWLIRKEYDRAFGYLSRRSYACYDLVRGPEQPPATSLDDAGQRIRAGLERTGNQVGKARNLETLIEATEPFHPTIRVMDHRDSRAFALSSPPNVFAEAADCAARAQGERFTGEIPLEYGAVFGMDFCF
jgi:hypothetical protein